MLQKNYGVNSFWCKNKSQTNAAISAILAAFDRVKIGSGFFCRGTRDGEKEGSEGEHVYIRCICSYCLLILL